MPLPNSIVEAGCLLPEVSLGGRKSQSGRGRISSYGTIVASVAGEIALENNLNRISAIIQNVDTVNITVTFGNGTLSTMTLAPLGNVQIDKYFPWTGAVVVAVAAATANVSVTEVSIQE